MHRQVQSDWVDILELCMCYGIDPICVPSRRENYARLPRSAHWQAQKDCMAAEGN